MATTKRSGALVAGSDVPALGDLDWFEVMFTDEGAVLVCTRCAEGAFVCSVDAGDTMSELAGMAGRHAAVCERES